MTAQHDRQPAIVTDGTDTIHKQTTFRLDGQTALVTGGTDGIGRHTALNLVDLGAQVIIVGRNPQKAEATIAIAHAQTANANITYYQHDLSLMREVQALATTLKAHHPPLDMLVHSAGVMLPKRVMTTEGLETVFAVQYFARHHLTHLLLDHLANGARVINISAAGTIPMKLHFKNLYGKGFYAGTYILTQESVANDLLILRLMRQHPDVRFYNFGPFYVKSNLFTHMPITFKLATNTIGRLMASTPERAAADVTRLLTEAPPSGLYARNITLIKPTRYRADVTVQDRLWQETQQILHQLAEE